MSSVYLLHTCVNALAYWLKPSTHSGFVSSFIIFFVFLDVAHPVIKTQPNTYGNRVSAREWHSKLLWNMQKKNVYVWRRVSWSCPCHVPTHMIKISCNQRVFSVNPRKNRLRMQSACGECVYVLACATDMHHSYHNCIQYYYQEQSTFINIWFAIKTPAEEFYTKVWMEYVVVNLWCGLPGRRKKAQGRAQNILISFFFFPSVNICCCSGSGMVSRTDGTIPTKTESNSKRYGTSRVCTQLYTYKNW